METVLYGKKGKDCLISQETSGKSHAVFPGKPQRTASFRPQQQIQSDKWLKYAMLGYSATTQQSLASFE